MKKFEVITRPSGIVLISSDKTIFIITQSDNSVNIVTDANVQCATLDDIGAAGFVNVQCYDPKKSFIHCKKNDFFTIEKFIDVIKFIFEKYEL